MNLFDAYRKMFATFDDEPVIWWYCGGVTAHREGVGSVPIVQAETIMVYRTREVDANTFTIAWTEVGYFRDITTGETIEGWFNPFTQQLGPYPKQFKDGPATFTVRRSGESIDVALVQHNARVDGVALAATLGAASLGLVQTEIKTRTFHRADGSLPPLDSPEATKIETVLSIWSPLAAVNDPAVRNAPGRGFYRSGSRDAGAAGTWAGTTVAGTMHKARADERVNPQAWDRLQQRFPDFFRGDCIAPSFD